MAGQSAAHLDLEPADLEVEFVVHDHEAARVLDAVTACEHADTATPLSFM